MISDVQAQWHKLGSQADQYSLDDSVARTWMLWDYSKPFPSRVGYIKYHYGDWDDDKGTPIVIDMLEVNPAYQRQGVATRLVNELKRIATGDYFIAPGKFTQQGAAFWNATQPGDHVRGTETATRPNTRQWDTE